MSRLRHFISAALASLCLATTTASAGELIPFVLPWNDASPGITDLSSLNHQPAGKFGHITVDENAHFSANGERIRFWGVNITADSCFPTHEEAEGIAARLAKFGFNIVRFHHMDNNWGGGSLIDYSSETSRQLHAGNLEKLDYFIAQLKAHGIYANLNLINSREFKVADGLDSQVESALDWKQRHILGFVDPTFRDLEKEYARNLLTHRNPYTNLTYAEDPAIAVVEINNENGIFQQYFEGSIEQWPNVYKNQLQEEWNDWLQAKYASTDAVLDAWSGESVPFGDQLVTDTNFSNGTSAWNIEQHEGATYQATTGNFSGRQALKLDVTSAGAGWHVQLNQGGKTLVKDQLYTLSFRLRADADREVSVAIGQAYDPWGTVHSFPDISVSDEWKQHTFVFTSNVSDDNLRLNFNGFATQTGPVYFTDITLTEGGDLSASLPQGETLESATIASNSVSNSYLPNRSLDWTRFLTDLAQNYWSDMGSYIKNEIGFAGLVNGTTIMNSTPNIQGGFDLVDTHSYWRHPVFPGDAWDTSDWYVEPDSMVNFLNNTIGDLARQRVDGLPHTVSEYRHAYPNPYASEGPILIGAYASLQDWDGIYFFDYARGESWDQGYFNNYFNMNAHPSSMANALAAARMFRLGDVSAAQGQLLFNFNPDLETELVATRGQAWNVGDGRQLDIQPEHALRQRIALSIRSSATGIESEPPAPASGPIYTSDTEQLVWDLSAAKKGNVSINSPRFIGTVGYVNGRAFGTDDFGIEIGETQQDWATVSLTAQAGRFDHLDAATSILVIATGLTENTGLQWTDSSKRSVGTKWGSSPSLVEAIPATLTLPYAAERIEAWALDETGQRSASLPVTSVAENRAALAIGFDEKSIWYEIQVTGKSGFDAYLDWKAIQWPDEQDQTDPDISGPSADPDRDGIKNIIEFLGGLNPTVWDSQAPIKQEVVLLENRPAFRYTFPVPIEYALSNLALNQSANLELWGDLGTNDTELTVSRIPDTSTHDRVVITHQPTEFPAFSRLVVPTE